MDIQLAKMEDIGDLSELETENKSSIVAAINEVKNSGGDIPLQDINVSLNGVYVPEYPYRGIGTVSVNVEDVWLKRMKMARGLFSHELHIEFSEINLYDVWSAAYMFENCTSLKTMTIHANCIDHMPGIFYRCTSLKNVVFDCDTFASTSLIGRGDSSYSTTAMSDWSERMFSYASTDLDLTVHYKGKPWFRSAFCDCYAQSVTITSGYEGEEAVSAESAFRNSRCTYIDLPDIKISTLYFAFAGCVNLKYITGGDFTLCTSMYDAFNGCSELVSFGCTDFPKCTTFYYAFKDCVKLT